MNTVAKWQRVAERVHVRACESGNAVVVEGDDGLLAIGPVDSATVAELSAKPVLFAAGGARTAGACVAHESAPGDVTFSSVWACDLGGCYVEAVYVGRGATSSDIVFNVPAAQVLVVGDLIRNPGPPAYTETSWPLEWPATLDMVRALATSETIVVPGRGPVVDREFVEDQRHEVVGIAEQLNQLAQTGASMEQALERGTWPFGGDLLRHALERGYAQWTP